MTRVLFGALAVADAVLLAYLFLLYGWFAFDFNDSRSSSVGALIILVQWIVVIAERAFFAAYFAVIGASIWRDLAGRERPRWAAILGTPVLLIALIGIGLTWWYTVYMIATRPPGFINDRLTMFDALAGAVDSTGVDLFGTRYYAGGSIGRFLIILLGAGYLAEKYLLQSWRVRWPVPILPLVAIGWVGWIVHDGERRLRDFVTQYAWRPIAPEVPWIEALAACESLGDGWRLPRREELTRFLATSPADVQAWEGSAWTNTIAEGGEWAVAVDLKPRKSGRWNKGSEPTRDESLCETRTQPGYAMDWFARLRPDVCARTTQSQYLFTPGLKLTVLQRGNIAVTQPPAAAICVRAPADAPRIPIRERRGYRDEQEFTRAGEFRQEMAAKCGVNSDRNRAACFVFAPDLPPFEETDDERMMRAFCEVARNGEGCHRYAEFMAGRPGAADRALRYRELACKRGYAPACS